jgi:hypothetical protein
MQHRSFILATADFITFEIAFMGGYVQMHMFRTSPCTE